MPVIEGIRFPETYLERLVDRLHHWWHKPRLPRQSEPDWEPSLLEVLVLYADD